MSYSMINGIRYGVILFCHLLLLVNSLPAFEGQFDVLSLLPDTLPIIVVNDNNAAHHIPRRIWVAVKDRKDDLPGHLKSFFERNPKWQVNVCDNDCKDKFMSSVFNGTSILWAYNLINPLVGAAKADIWRYSVLYTYGGLYLDDDSDIKTPLDEVIAVVSLC